ncbi:hypothetical protein DPMN_022960 [Dreissena polymorpha]|uniref:Uncharacterized protein n=1 Tax=Dreissena polymorpha TaxID=45954 RepID=A0A9D4LM52_DREPO|nr:hypothetical protein DPMN_022960 [Dreissena polymorpha]
MASNKKEREQKFSLDYYIILCNLMGEDCGVAFLHGLSNHDLMRHRFTEVMQARCASADTDEHPSCNSNKKEPQTKMVVPML